MMESEKSDIREAIIAPEFGAGWSTWVHQGREAEDMCLFDPELIADIKKNGAPSDEGLEDFAMRFEQRFGDRPYIPRSRDLVVVEVDGPFRVHEYDGAETIVYARDEQYR